MSLESKYKLVYNKRKTEEKGDVNKKRMEKVNRRKPGEEGVEEK